MLEQETDRVPGKVFELQLTDYDHRSLVETAMGRYKSLIGPRLRARGFVGRQTGLPSAWLC
jgi:hypothetical protein